jgi:hypothetical protein
VGKSVCRNGRKQLRERTSVEAGDDDGLGADDELRDRRRAGPAGIEREAGRTAVVGAEFDPNGSNAAGCGGNGSLTVAVDGRGIVDEDAIASGDTYVERMIGVVFVAEEDGRRFGGGGLWASSAITVDPWLGAGLRHLCEDTTVPV